MGRSIYTPSGAAVIYYAHVEHSYYCRTCAHCREYEMHIDEGETACARCEAANRIADVQYDDDTTRDNWDADLENLIHELRAAFPSLTECDQEYCWLGDEDHVILENRHAVVTVSEYCGLVAVCLTPREGTGWKEGITPATAHHWCAQIEAKFRRIVAEAFGPELHKTGTMSNGEAIYRRAA